MTGNEIAICVLGGLGLFFVISIVMYFRSEIGDEKYIKVAMELRLRPQLCKSLPFGQISQWRYFMFMVCVVGDARDKTQHENAERDKEWIAQLPRHDKLEG